MHYTEAKTTKTQPKRDSRGHFINKNAHMKKLANEAVKELKGIDKKSKIIPQTPLLETSAKAPELPLAEQVKRLKSDMEALKQGMSNYQTSYLDRETKHGQAIYQINEAIASHERTLSDHHQSHSYVDFASRDYENVQNAQRDRAAFDWLRKLKDKFAGSQTNYAYPLTREEINDIARKWARKNVAMGAVAIGYLACAVASMANIGVAIIVIPVGFAIAVALNIVIWRE